MTNNLKNARISLDKSPLFYLMNITSDGNYLYVNECYINKLLNKKNSFIGLSFYNLIHPNDVKKTSEIHTKCLDNPDKTFVLVVRLRSKKGNYIYTHWEFRAGLDSQQNPIGICCIGYDVSKYIAKQIQLKQAQKENAEKRAIIEEIIFQHSHLMRAPLSNIMGLINLLLDNSLSGIEIASTYKIIIESTNQLDEIIRKVVIDSRNISTNKLSIVKH